MRERVVVSGAVVGPTGALVAGWVQLGGAPRRSVSDVVRIDAGGHEQTIRLAADARFDPVERRAATWRALEGDERAQRCVDDAPGPDVEVKLVAAVLRGGDPVSLWVETCAGEHSRVAHAVAIGDDHPTKLARLRERLESRAQRPVREAVKREVEAPRERNDALGDRLARNYGLMIAGPGLAIAAIAGWLLTGTLQVMVALAACVLAFVPVVLDALLIPRFRDGTGDTSSLAVPGAAFVIAGAIVVSFAGMMVRDGGVDPDRAIAAAIFMYGGTGIAAAAALWCMAATRARRRSISALIAAPPHPSPVADGVWGASDGRLLAGPAGSASAGNDAVMVAVGETAVSWGKATRDSNGVSSRSTSTSHFTAIASDPVLDTPHGQITVRLAGAAWLSALRLGKHTGTTSVGDHAISADVIAARQPVRVAGRTRDGVFMRGGEGSLLVFAGPFGADVGRVLRRLRWRERGSVALAWLGVLAYPSVIVWASVR